jgi:MoaA/NifB/PqqE/SkfB family radical SAM enzyme
MRTERVFTNETCNQNCWFCNARRPTEQPAFVAKPAVWRRIAEAQSTGAGQIVLTGGEPTMRSDLADLVRRAAARGAHVTLETNAALIDDTRASQLAAAGLGTARVQLVAWGGEAADAITRLPGGFAGALRGARALIAAGVKVEITTPVVRRNLDLVAALPREIVAAQLAVEALVLITPVSAPSPAECASLAEIGRAVTAVAEEGRRVGLTVRLDSSTFAPPCVFEKPGRVAHLFALNRGNASRPGYERVAACATCLVNERCPGLPLPVATQRQLAPQPITEDRLRRRLTAVSTVEEQTAREFVGRDEARGLDRAIPEYTVRVNFHCNQACEFCFVSTHLPPPADAAVRAAIERAGAESAALVLSGGEPTLNPHLVEYVRLAKRVGVRTVELQTNATRLAGRGLAPALADAGLDRAMVSLHGSTAALSDAITDAPGTFAETVRGIDELVQTPIHVRLNFVFCQANREDFPRFVDFVADRWPSLAASASLDTGIVFSFVGSHTDVVPRSRTLIPRFTEIMPSLLAGLARGHAVGLRVSGFDSMCGMPLCLVPPQARSQFSTVELAPGAGDGEFVKGAACASCAEAQRCFGIRRGYAELYGTAELRAIAGDVAAPAAS